jgi:hypothetical protein
LIPGQHYIILLGSTLALEERGNLGMLFDQLEVRNSTLINIELFFEISLLTAGLFRLGSSVEGSMFSFWLMTGPIDSFD